jgi:hypothetical protein
MTAVRSKAPVPKDDVLGKTVVWEVIESVAM